MADTAETPKEEIRCPWYGFHYTGKTLDAFVSTHADQCALGIECYVHCKMGLEGEIPNWHKCEKNSAAANREIETIFAETKFHPSQYDQGDGVPGISCKDWTDFIMEGKPLPISTNSESAKL